MKTKQSRKEKQVREIYNLAYNKTMTQDQIAKKYNVDTSTVSRIKNRKKWKYLCL